MIRLLYRRLRRAVNTAIGRDVQFAVQTCIPTLRHGSEYGGWWIASEDLSANSIVYSFGVGEDITFDLSLIQHCGVTVHAFDPTPRSIAWVRQQSLPSQFTLHEVGLAAYDGRATFFPPLDTGHISHTIIDRAATRHRAISVEVRRLSTLMGALGHDRVDLLKMDIEGAEYTVIDDILEAAIPIRQILVEFHHRFPGVGIGPTRRAVKLLNAAGYLIFAASQSGEEYSFVRYSP